MKNIEFKSPILITGSHRSGTTWIGKVIAFSPDVTYINEPFNLLHRPEICKAKFDKWFTYICEENEQLYLEDLKRCFTFKYNLIEEVNSCGSIKDILRMGRDFASFSTANILSKRPLSKDPIAIFSAEWLATQFDMQVIVMIRHPAAFVGSLKTAQWSHPFEDFLKQPLLVEKLKKYKNQIEEFAIHEKDIVEQGILLWNIIHYMILQYRQKHPNWIFIGHEDISSYPLSEFENLYKRLNLNFSDSIKKNLIRTATEKKTYIVRNHLIRDSKSNIFTWKKRLTPEEIERVKIGTAEIFNQFYLEDDWS